MEDSYEMKQEPINYTMPSIVHLNSESTNNTNKLAKTSEKVLSNKQDVNPVTADIVYIKYEEKQIENQPPVSPNVCPLHQGEESSTIESCKGGVDTKECEEVDCNYCPHQAESNGEPIFESLSKYNSLCFYCSMLYKYKLNSMACNFSSKYICTECSVTAQDVQEIFTHYKTHMDEATCICPRNAIEKQGVPSNNIVLNEDKQGTFQCSFCSYSGKRSQNLKRHMITHTGERPYECKLCPYRAPDASSLRVHCKTHSGERPFMCTECPYRASQKSTLRTHLKVHTGEKPYPCVQCAYRASNQTNLRSHIKTHTGEKPYACTYCSYCSTQSSALKCHVRIHTGEKPYQCPKCPYKAAALGNLKSHTKVHKDS